MSRSEMDALGWPEIDVLLVSGDAYIDHPSFGIALLGRHLVSKGFRVGVAAQPRWQGAEALDDMRRMGRPRLLAGVAAGAIDSMLAHYTAFRKIRRDDAYTPGGLAGKRPNRAVIVYANLVRKAFPGLPVAIGGIEASLRRASHYDFWSDSLRRSILLDSKADCLIYGMGEISLAAVAAMTEAAVSTGQDVRPSLRRAFRAIPGLAVALGRTEAELVRRQLPPVSLLPSHEAILADPFLLVKATREMERQVHQGTGPLYQACGDQAVMLNRPSPPLSTPELDALYALPFSRLSHPSYTESIPAWEMIRTSITSHRGCGGGCAFCSLALHQSRRIASRSKDSILQETRAITGQRVRERVPRWAGAISDVGGPSANMWQGSCARPSPPCERSSCLHPRPCPFFRVDQAAGVALLREVARQPGVRHVRVASGVRFDLALADADAVRAYTMEFTGGQLKIAPEHIAGHVLDLMRKPGLTIFEEFIGTFARLSRESGKEQYVVPYLMSAHPGCTDQDMRDLANWLRARNWSPRQVQCFIPTPGTMATAMFFSGKDETGKPIHVARTDAERMRQHYLLLGESPAGGRTGSRKPRTPGNSPRKLPGRSRADGQRRSKPPRR